MKLGQILSVMRDVLPAPLIQELQMLTDKVKTVPYEEVESVIQETCGESDEFCIFVDHEPLAGASMSQVHKAMMTDGSDVVFKVQRPDIRELIEIDLTILENLADRAEKSLPYLRPFNPKGLIEEFSKQMRKELDQFSFGDTMNTMTSILHRYEIVMPGSFMLMIKVITMIGDVGSRLDPEFDIIGTTKPYLNKLIISSVFSAESLDDARQAVTREVLDFPKAFRKFMENFSSGRSRMEVTVPELRGLDSVEYLAQKMVYSVLAVGLMISVALIAPTCVNPFTEWQGYLLMGGLAGLVLSILKLWSLKPKK